MEYQININQEAVEEAKGKSEQINTARIKSEGQEISRAGIHAIQNTEGDCIKALQKHMNQEQIMVESIGSSLMSIMEHIAQAANALTEQDDKHAFSHDVK